MSRAFSRARAAGPSGLSDAAGGIVAGGAGTIAAAPVDFTADKQERGVVAIAVGNQPIDRVESLVA